jgi:hypothetical protein
MALPGLNVDQQTSIGNRTKDSILAICTTPAKKYIKMDINARRIKIERRASAKENDLGSLCFGVGDSGTWVKKFTVASQCVEPAGDGQGKFVIVVKNQRDWAFVELHQLGF